MTAVGTTLGRAAGWAAAPFFAALSLARRARAVHPRGPVFHADVSLDATVPSHLRALGDRLSGPALVRFSGALWKRAEGVPEPLGCALRVRRTKAESVEPAGDDQDLLFATIRRPWTMFFAPLTTNQRDYLANDYFAVSPFDVGLADEVYLRLHPAGRSSTHERGGTRTERLARDVMRGEARLVLEASKKPFGPWTPFADVVVERAAEVDGAALPSVPRGQGSAPARLRARAAEGRVSGEPERAPVTAMSRR